MCCHTAEIIRGAILATPVIGVAFAWIRNKLICRKCREEDDSDKKE